MNNSTFYGENVHRKVFWKFLEVKMSWNLGPFLLKILPRYKIPFTIGSASFKWLHIIVRLGYQVKIWSKSCRKSPKDLCKRLRITLKSANQKKWRLPSKKKPILCLLGKLSCTRLSFVLLNLSLAILSCQDIYQW